jgi:2-iminobutanoate/2-iminopropanoate deaminase
VGSPSHLGFLEDRLLPIVRAGAVTFNEGGKESPMTRAVLDKETSSLAMPWEEQYGYSQAVRVGDTLYLSGQVSHDDAGNFFAVGDMEGQMRQAYKNIEKILAGYGATMDSLVEEVLYVTDMQAAFDAAVKIRRDVFAGFPAVASTIVEINRLAFPEFLIEIKGIARL